MFNFEQLDIDPSFHVVQPHTTMAEIKALFNQYRFMVLEGSFPYVIASSERKQLELVDPEMTMEIWIERMDLPHSHKCFSLSELENLDSPWERPILICGKPAQIEGIVTAGAMIHSLNQENKKLTAYLDTFVETVNDAVTAVDQDGRVIYWNKTAEQVYGIPKETIIGRKIGEHFDKESLMLHRILDEGRTVRRVYHQPAPNTHVLISASPIMENNHIIGGISTEQDITRIVQLNEELYSMLPIRIEQDKPFSSIIGLGPAYKRSLEVAKKFANSTTPVLLIGEPGSGKEMLAQAIHFGGEQKNRPFLALHCGALPGGLLETELFGYQGGAFTSEEDQGKKGKLELAGGGTLLLEEIDEMPLDIQLKLLQFLKSKSFFRIGGNTAISTETRIIATTQTLLQPLMEQGHFMEDLFYQLNAMSIEIPPLRERTEDIPELVQAFIHEFTVQYQKPIPKIQADVMTALMNYEWPGNVRELRNVMERIIILCDGDTITSADLPPGLVASKVLFDESQEEEEETIRKARFVHDNEEVIIQKALHKAYGNKSAAAKLLGISRGTLYKKIREYSLKE